MVDRITPAPTAETLAEAERLTGCTDLCAVEAEPFHQWVIEDNFPTGRPDWAAGGAVFVHDVAPYEQMKLTMLNGAHSMLAYLGVLVGHRHVRDVMADPALHVLVRRHLAAAAALLPPLPGIDLGAYADDLAQRFANPALAHETRQIAMDGTEKLPQRLLAPARQAIAQGRDPRPFAFAVAGWMRHALATDEAGGALTLHDPRAAEIAAALARVGGSAPSIYQALDSLPGLFPSALSGSQIWSSALIEALDRMLTQGVAAAIEVEAFGA
jgi:fructuronate reductase